MYSFNNLKLLIVLYCLIELTTEAKATECYSCNGASSHDECTAVQICNSGDDGSCLTEVRTNNNVDTITKQCKQTQSCMGLESQNINTCSIGSQNYVCYYCCQGDLCNVADGQTTSTTTSSTSTTTTSTIYSTTSTMSPPTSLTTLMLNTSPPQNVCPPLEPPLYGSYFCTDGFNDRSKCSFVCDQSYALSLTSGKNNRCICSSSTGCKWMGVAATCEFLYPDPISCDIPDFRGATYSVLDTWPTGALLRVNVRPNLSSNNGFSIALLFSQSLPAGAEILVGDMELSATSTDRRIFTYNSMNHNADVSRFQLYSVYLWVRGMPENSDPSSYSAMVGFYNSIVFDASCLQIISPVRPLPSTTAPPTSSQASTASTTSRSTTQATSQPTTKSTTQPTTTSTSTTTTTTTTTVGTGSTDCEVLPNGVSNPGYIILNRGYNEGNTFKFTARAQKFPDNKGPLARWTMKIEFSDPVDSLQAFIADPEGPLENGKVWLLHPKGYNDGVGNGEGNDPLQILFIAGMQGAAAAPDAFVTFCRNGAKPNLAVTGGNGGTGGGGVTASSQAPSSTDPVVTFTIPTQSPSTGARCESSSPFGSLPSSSGRTDAARFIPSSVPIKAGEFDYNKILHMSLLFYEAQRSGKLPANNRIPWRGDSGLKDGCDVGHDLSGGLYDAGDNVKFGFPMAYTGTVLAWSMIEFRDAYIDSGDVGNSEATLKWIADYIVKAHTATNELYVQVGNPTDDHGTWTRPENVNKQRISYKIDSENPGSEVAAESAAALAAASVVFRTKDSSYADMLIVHARALYSFADTYRGSYHESVPSVTNFYKSWNGYNDELLWAAIWLYQATGEMSYLRQVEERYVEYGANAVPGEFSWDNKYAGVQVILAQVTKTQIYIDAVEKFFKYANESVVKTPRGLTWKIQWGPNRYAANFALIAAMGAKVESSETKRKVYIDYAKTQINYMLGKNEIGKSYVVGHTNDSPKRPHHRSSSCPAWNFHPVPVCSWNDYNRAGANPHVLFGALVGGPNAQGQYSDDRKNFVTNEVATDYNAGFQATVAALQFYRIQGDL